MKSLIYYNYWWASLCNLLSWTNIPLATVVHGKAYYIWRTSRPSYQGEGSMSMSSLHGSEGFWVVPSILQTNKPHMLVTPCLTQWSNWMWQPAMSHGPSQTSQISKMCLRNGPAWSLQSLISSWQPSFSLTETLSCGGCISSSSGTNCSTLCIYTTMICCAACKHTTMILCDNRPAEVS